MITKSELNTYASLLNKKDRDEQLKFLVEGEKLIMEAMNYNYECDIILARKEILGRDDEQIKMILSHPKKIEIISEKELKKIQSTVTSQGIVGVFNKKPATKSSKEYISDLIVALDGINDPGNVGTIIRNADWFGIDVIILSDDCADIFNTKTIRASAGSIFHTKCLISFNLAQTLCDYKIRGYRILCADISGKSLDEFTNQKKQIIIFSNEANGPSDELISIADEKLTIPKLGKAESLNVASASAIILNKLTNPN